jgi:asparagine synthase (glutamine-hydrolysing)
MCGIVGIVNFDTAPADEAVLRRMCDALAHRGPDGEGQHVDGAVGLGHRRLAIIDPSPAGLQPMANEAGDVFITYNGEIYNFRELRAELEAEGHAFRSQTDSEVVVHAYEQWGDACVERFNGMFAFAVYDRRGGARGARLLLARDRYGVKPLYYTANAARLLFASEIKALLRHPAVSAKVCWQALSEYFTFQNVFSDVTLFDGVRLLPAGCVMTVEPATGRLTQRRYWDYRFASGGLDVSEAEATEELQRLFEQAVVRQLVADVPVGAYLSGGMDSASITAVATRHIRRMRTFTGGFDLSSASGLELGFDERAASERLANQFKTEHYEMVLHAGDMEHVLPELVWSLEDLRVGQSYPNYYVARLASRFVKVVLSGAGGDELFAGYPWRYYRGLQHAATPAAYLAGYYQYWQRLVPDEDRPQFFNARAYRCVREHDPRQAFERVFDGQPVGGSSIEEIVNASLYLESRTFLHGLLVVEDKLSMAHSLETRVPFLDNDLVDFALQVPPRMKLRDLARAPQVDEDDVGKFTIARGSADGKLILRRAMQHLLPAEIHGGRKQGFSAPDASWFAGESIGYVTRLLCDRSARLNEFINPAYVRAIVEEHSAGRVNHRLLIWSLLSFECWCRHFLDGQPAAAA